MLEWKMGGLPQFNLKKKKKTVGIHRSGRAVMAAMLAKSVNIIGY